MANMSYCRFENTYHDLMDCYENIDGDLSDSENEYRSKLVELCHDLAEENEDYI